MRAASHSLHQIRPFIESVVYRPFALIHDQIVWTLSAFRSRGNQWPDGRLFTERSWQVLRMGSPIRAGGPAFRVYSPARSRTFGWTRFLIRQRGR